MLISWGEITLTYSGNRFERRTDGTKTCMAKAPIPQANKDATNHIGHQGSDDFELQQPQRPFLELIVLMLVIGFNQLILI